MSGHALGVALILLVVAIWVLSGELIQGIERSGVGPFFLTYFSTTLFTVYLPLLACRGALAKADAAVAAETEAETEALVGGGEGGGAGAAGAEGGGASSSKAPLPTRELARLALMFCPFWFLANYLYNASLGLTSVASSTIISNTASVFTLIIGSLHQRKRPEAKTLGAVLLNVSGVAVVSLSDVYYPPDRGGGSKGQDGSAPLLGNLLALCGAGFYGLYTVMLANLLESERVEMPRFFGMLGAVNCATLWVVGLALVAAGLEPMPGMPSRRIAELLLLNALVGTVLSDVIWAKSVLLTSPVVATAGLSLTIPAAMVADGFMGKRSFNAIYIAGSALVVCGFVLLEQTTEDAAGAGVERDAGGKELCNPQRAASRT